LPLPGLFYFCFERLMSSIHTADRARPSAPLLTIFMSCSSILGLAVGASASAGDPPAALTQPSTQPSTQPGTQPASQPAHRRIELAEGLVVFPDSHSVEIKATTCLKSGFLEQVACSPQTREHESLLVVEVKPSSIHAGLLLAGFVPGKPGSWKYENETFSFVPPTGDAVTILARYERDGRTVEEPIRHWIRDARNHRPFPDESWIFGGSAFATNPQWMGPGEHYVADMTGSIIGLVTFGDEMIGLGEVIPDQADVQEPEWEVDPDRVPAVGAAVTLIIRRREAPVTAPASAASAPASAPSPK
jgi:hypothetical protein